MSDIEHRHVTKAITDIIGKDIDPKRICLCANAAIAICHWHQGKVAELPVKPSVPEVQNPRTFGDDLISQRAGASFLNIFGKR